MLPRGWWERSWIMFDSVNFPAKALDYGRSWPEAWTWMCDAFNAMAWVDEKPVHRSFRPCSHSLRRSCRSGRRHRWRCTPGAPAVCIVHVAAAGGTGGRCIAGAPAACVVRVAAAGGAGDRCIAGVCDRAPALHRIDTAIGVTATGIAGGDAVGVATAGGAASPAWIRFGVGCARGYSREQFGPVRAAYIHP